MPGLIRHPAADNLKNTGFPFDYAQGGESCDVAQEHEPVERHVEPWVKPGMTKQQNIRFEYYKAVCLTQNPFYA